MGIVEAFLYGMVQGLTEYLPVSSSAHLVLLPYFLKQPDPGLAFDVFLHIGTLLATTIYFFKDWVAILKNPIPKEDVAQQTLSWVHLIIGTLPAVLIGVMLHHWIQDHTRAIPIQAATLAAFGVILWLVDRFQAKNRPMREATYKDMFIIGCMQALALVPGVSRSGSTITGARALGFSRVDACRISFLLSMPVTLGAIIFEARHWRELLESTVGLLPLCIAGLGAFAFGALAIRMMMTLMSRVTFAVFTVYRVALAALILYLF